MIGYIFVACYTSLFWLLYKPVIPKLSAAISNSFRNLDKHQKRIWSENAVSTIHAVVVFLLSVWNLLFDKVTLEQPVLGAGWAVVHLAAIAAAFMIVDIGIMLSVGDRSVFFYFHHLSVAFACIFCLIEGRFCPWFSSLKSLSEASTPFVHANWFLKVTGVSESSVLSKLLTYVVFTLCRILVIPFFWFYAYVYWDEGWGEQVTKVVVAPVLRAAMLKLLTLLIVAGLLGFVESDSVCGDKVCENGGVCSQNTCLCNNDYEGTTCSKKKLTTVALIAIILICIFLLLAVLITVCIIKRRKGRQQVPLIDKESRRSNYNDEEEPRINIAEADIQENLRKHSKNQQVPVSTISEPGASRPVLTSLSQDEPYSRNSQQPKSSILAKPEHSNSVVTPPKLETNRTTAEIPLRKPQNSVHDQSDIIRRERPVPAKRVLADQNSTIGSSVKMHSGEPLAPVNYLTPRSTTSTNSTTDYFSTGASFWYPAYVGGPTGGMGSSLMMVGSSTSLTKVPSRK
ncbi:DgyrCDS6288 [Dimorphilus gyrociliatus]|uniref:DgyrCDS6288 n=1 Tax=Dimorphilus gyrociliatus TaxID=2664684 RepID=A0A7I8VP74_9ANNE|nr:DgyrCDS6288 [Dimorphilus gyrociliatus]